MSRARRPRGYREDGRKSGKLSASIDGALLDEIQAIADAENATVSRVAERLLRRGLNAEEADKMKLLKSALREICLLGDVDCDIAPQLARQALENV